MAECAKEALGEVAKTKGVSAGMLVTQLISRETGVPLEELLRDNNQEVLPESA
ncbi:hypothetical protein ACIRRA_39940 [Nocardia sp. NPDC101769]|uniref:hypothetical protein n=1 Tax=Nocardia sp. NPDC101769 TaxID=3364333 RepID=UPI0037FBF302